MEAKADNSTRTCGSVPPEREHDGLCDFVPPDAQTSDYYRTYDIPKRFDHPYWFKGYAQKPVHPVYRTSNSDYGARPPSVHTMPTRFSAKSQKFSEHLGSCGMFKNHSLNTAMDKTNVPDH